jgi:hypothetical protein
MDFICDWLSKLLSAGCVFDGMVVGSHRYARRNPADIDSIIFKYNVSACCKIYRFVEFVGFLQQDVVEIDITILEWSQRHLMFDD